MRFGFIIMMTVIISSCSSNEEAGTETTKPEKEERHELVQTEGNKYTEYYDEANKHIKFEGFQDDQQKRHGKWTHYSESGIEISMTMYEHGLKQGHSIVHYPNGAIYYYGEYDHDTMVGVWKTYDQQGKIKEEKDYGMPGK